VKTSAESSLSTSERPLDGRRIGISISESDHLEDIGLENVNSLTVDLSRRLVSLGATVVLGHNWRHGGVMEAISQFALAYKNQMGDRQRPIIINFVAHPDQPSLSENEKKELSSFIQNHRITWTDHGPQILKLLREKALLNIFEQDFSAMLKTSKLEAERARSLSALRYRLASTCEARIVIGGRTTGYQGFMPGILEELWWSLALNKPILLSTALDGVARAATDIKSEAAQIILQTKGHQLPGAFLKDTYQTMIQLEASRRAQQLRVVQELSGEALLPQLLNLLVKHRSNP